CGSGGALKKDMELPKLRLLARRNRSRWPVGPMRWAVAARRARRGRRHENRSLRLVEFWTHELNYRIMLSGQSFKPALQIRSRQRKRAHGGPPARAASVSPSRRAGAARGSADEELHRILQSPLDLL